MPRIPLPDYEPISASPEAPRADMHMYDDEFAAGRNLASSVANLAGTAADIRQKAVDADEQMQLRNNLLTLDAWQQDFVDEHKNDDPKTWEDEFQKQSAAKIAQLTPDGLSARGQRSYADQMGLWKIRANSDIRHTANLKIASNGIAKGNALVDSMIARGSEQGASDAVDLMASHNLISQADAQLRKQAIIPAIQEQKAYDAINNDSYAALQQLRDDSNFTALSPHQRKTLITAAQYSYNQQRITTARDVAARIDQGDYPTQAELDDWERRKIFTKPQLDQLTIQAYQREIQRPENQAKTFMDFKNSLAGVDPNDREKEAEIRANLFYLHGNLRDTATKMVNDLFNPRSVMNSDTGKRVVGVLDQMKNSGLFGEYYDVVPDKNDPSGLKTVKKLNPDKAAVAEDAYMNAYNAMKTYLANNPHATVGDALRHLTDLTRDTQSDAVLNSFTKPPPPPTPAPKPAAQTKAPSPMPSIRQPVFGLH